MTLNRMSKLYLHSWVTEFVTVLNSMLFDLNIHKLNHNRVTSLKKLLVPYLQGNSLYYAIYKSKFFLYATQT